MGALDAAVQRAEEAYEELEDEAERAAFLEAILREIHAARTAGEIAEALLERLRRTSRLQ
jgi:hypothetical protein